MEAPEKIYIFDNPILDFTRLSVRQSDTDIEYVRKDAFIEKALKFLDEKFYFNNLHYSIESGLFDSKEKMFKDFEKYMEE